MEYQGKCVEAVPHIPLEVIGRLERCAKKTKAEIIVVEVGGTVGEYQNVLYLEAARMLHLRNPQDVLFVLVSYLPIPSKIGEMKTKPTQWAAHSLNEVGIVPDFILCRAERPIDEVRRQKISVFCSVSPQNVISAPDVESIYDIPLNFAKEKLAEKILKSFKLPVRPSKLKDWEKLAATIKTARRQVRIGIVGKYFASGEFVLPDAYISVIESIKHAAWFFGAKPVIEWINSDLYEKTPAKLAELKKFDGILVPGGFGKRGVEGKIAAIRYARENKIPYLGLCYGMQLAVIEFARHVAGLKAANTTEIDPRTKYPVIHIMPEQAKLIAAKNYGNSMRLGAYPCKLNKQSKVYKYYGIEKISERHRHRYEFNNDYRQKLESLGLRIAGTSPDNKLVEIVELPNHPFFVGSQFHPEFKSRPLQPHPLFREFVRAALKK